MPRDVHAQQSIFLTMLGPRGTQVWEVREGGLDGSNPGSRADLLGEGLDRILRTHHSSREVAELAAAALTRPRVGAGGVAKEDFPTGVGTTVPTTLRAFTDGEHEEAPLTGAAVLQRAPFLHEGLLVWLLLPEGTEVRHVPASREVPLAPVLGMSHVVVIRVAEANQCGTPHATCHHDLTDHAGDVRNLNRTELAA